MNTDCRKDLNIQSYFVVVLENIHFLWWVTIAKWQRKIHTEICKTCFVLIAFQDHWVDCTIRLTLTGGWDLFYFGRVNPETLFLPKVLWIWNNSYDLLQYFLACVWTTMNAAAWTALASMFHYSFEDLKVFRHILCVYMHVKFNFWI